MSTTQAKTEPKKDDRRRGGRQGRRPRRQREEREFDQKIIDISRVTRVTEGGKQMSFRAVVAIGDHKNRVGVGVGKGKDVTNAIQKAVNRAEKDIIHLKFNDQGTIAHESKVKFGSALVMIRPAAQGTGIIAGGVMRTVFELSGVKNIVSKMYGSKNKINNARATIEALKNLKA